MARKTKNLVFRKNYIAYKTTQKTSSLEKYYLEIMLIDMSTRFANQVGGKWGAATKLLALAPHIKTHFGQNPIPLNYLIFLSDCYRPFSTLSSIFRRTFST
jgi:hypothetical protein